MVGFAWDEFTKTGKQHKIKNQIQAMYSQVIQKRLSNKASTSPVGGYSSIKPNSAWFPISTEHLLGGKR